MERAFRRYKRGKKVMYEKLKVRVLYLNLKKCKGEKKKWKKKY